MNLLRFVLRLLGLVPWLLLGLLSVTFVFPLAGAGVRAWMMRHWSRVLLACCGVSVRTQGQAVLKGAVLTVANHVSWIDIFVLNTVRATSFIAKSEIRRWPVIGWLVAGAGTVFIERGQRHAVSVVSKDMLTRFEQGVAVGLFPEGTTSEGLDLRAFHASLFEPACGLDVAVQPVALRFLHRGQRSGYAAFVGEESLVANLWRVLGTTGVAVEAIYLPPLTTQTPEGTARTRQELARDAHEAIMQSIKVAD